MLNVKEEITATKAKIEELESGMMMLIPLRRYYKQLQKIQNGQEPELDADQENSAAVDAEAGLPEN